jgi:transposase
MRDGHPTPEAVRQAIVRAFNEQGFTYQQIADFLGIGIATVNRVLRLHRKTGSVKPRPKGGGWRSPIRGKAAEELKRLVAAKPDSTVAELRDAFVIKTRLKTSVSSVKRALHRLGYTHKKRSSSPRSETRRKTSGDAVSWRPS